MQQQQQQQHLLLHIVKETDEGKSLRSTEKGETKNRRPFTRIPVVGPMGALLGGPKGLLHGHAEESSLQLQETKKDRQTTK